MTTCSPITLSPSYAVAFITMGCAKNEVDTASMQARLMQAGFSLAGCLEEADVIVVNTCAFIQSATEESLEVIFDLASIPACAHGTVPIIVSGCMPARYGDELAQELGEASALIPCSREDDIVEVISQVMNNRASSDSSSEFREEDLPAIDQAAQDALDTFVWAPLPEDDRYSAYVKISDGCDRMCAYCTIPFIRGSYHSFTYDDIRRDVLYQVNHGVREIVLIAQDTGRWGQDFEEPLSLAWLMDTLAQEFSNTWIRVMYLQPEGITDELLHTMARHDNICSYLDIPLQHTSKRILRLMNRAGERSSFEALIEHIKQLVPDITLRTTLIAGFPSETAEEFEDLLDFVSEGYFDYVGVFPYSREEGTVAYNLPDQIEEEEKIERASEVRACADVVGSAAVASRIGSMVDVLVLGYEEDGQLFGRAQCQAPDVDGITFIESGVPGEIVTVRIGDTLMYEMESE